MTANPPVAVLENVTLEDGFAAEAAVRDVNLSVRPGERVLILTEPGSPLPPVGDLMQGLVEPQAGRVLFEGREWGQRNPAEVAAARAKIGRVPDPPRWISNLDVDENVFLAVRHHTNWPDQKIEAEALRLARAFGLEDLPRVRPVRARPSELRVAEWVRALLGDKVLLIFERPLRGAPEDRAPLLGAHVQSHGAAVIWLQDTTDPDIFDAMKPTQCLRWRRGKLESDGAPR